MENIYNHLNKNSIDSVLKKYCVPGSLLHEQQVKQHSMQVFDFLYPETVEAEAHLLEVAALLHDLGHFINQKKHDLHTFHIIMYDYAFASVPKELRTALALIAGGHRKKLHFNLVDISKSDKQLVEKLAAILRIADALDYTRQYGLKIKQITLDDKELSLKMSDAYPLIISERVQKKSALFEAVYGLNVALCCD